LLVTTIHLKWTPSYLDSLWPFRELDDGKLLFSFFVLIYSRRWHTAMNPTFRARGREELHRLRHPVPSPRQFQITLASQKSDTPTQHEIKMLFKKLCRRYLKLRHPPPDKEMEPLWRMREYVDV
jgi:hypothetical protein